MRKPMVTCLVCRNPLVPEDADPANIGNLLCKLQCRDTFADMQDALESAQVHEGWRYIAFEYILSVARMTSDPHKLALRFTDVVLESGSNRHMDIVRLIPMRGNQRPLQRLTDQRMRTMSATLLNESLQPDSDYVVPSEIVRETGRWFDEMVQADRSLLTYGEAEVTPLLFGNEFPFDDGVDDTTRRLSAMFEAWSKL